MKVFARLAVLTAALSLANVSAPERTADAAVSVAVTFDALVLASHAIVLATPIEEHAQMEDGKIYTYTRLHVDTQVAGDAPTGSDVYVRAFGGVVDHIGMVSEGEPTFSVGKQQLLFLRHNASVPGAYNVTADAQGQFVVETTKTATGATSAEAKFRQSRATGLLLQPKNAQQAVDSAGAASGQSVKVTTTPQLATDVICARSTTEVVRDIATAYKRLHAR